ncbi:hypothetical protein GOP47_0008298 [Adiantum capillus-veneris]|uniref:GDT1 family protein n=1 Tax=Adiantum capillus-veneris TaxID=13818 RepID=A0A9D4UZ23_ADICA|nr:hypothetical protein GOP47_0008298 [Adiantum capillus-veneris]
MPALSARLGDLLRSHLEASSLPSSLQLRFYGNPLKKYSLGLHPFAVRSSPSSCLSPHVLKKDDIHNKSFFSTSEAEHQRLVVQEDIQLATDVTEQTTFSQIEIPDEMNANFQLGVASAAVALAFLACSQAWAGPEIATVQDATSWWGDLDDIKSGFVSAFLLIFFSEIGDKTFFIAAVLASRKSNAAVFTGTFGALVAMTFISVFLGRAFHYIDGVLPFSLGENDLPLDDLAAVVLLVYFGATTLLEAASMEGSKAQEEQQEAELAIAGLGGNGKGSAITNTAFATFGLVFVAEWGDKSFFSTIALSAASSPVGVVSGAVAGHGLATVLAVLGGSLLSNYISEKVTAYIGGSLFLIFAAFTLYEIVSVRS